MACPFVSLVGSIAGENGWTVVRTRRPWNSTCDYARRSLNLLLCIGKDPAGRASG